MALRNILILFLVLNYSLGCFIIDCPPIKKIYQTQKRNFENFNFQKKVKPTCASCGPEGGDYKCFGLQLCCSMTEGCLAPYSR